MRLIPCFIALALLTIGSVVLGADEKKNLAKPTTQPMSWRLEQHETAKAEIAGDAEAIVITIKETTGTDWHVQAVQTGLDLVDGKEYVLAFKAKASANCNVPVNAMIDKEDWHSIGLTETAEVTTEWKDFSYEFKADTVLKQQNRISFILGGDKGKVWIKGLSLTAK